MQVVVFLMHQRKLHLNNLLIPPQPLFPNHYLLVIIAPTVVYQSNYAEIAIAPPHPHDVLMQLAVKPLQKHIDRVIVAAVHE